jgi:hypothetical protein
MPDIDLADLRSEMESEREWREREMRQLRNHVAAIASDDSRRVARKALVVMLYAHFEGTCKALLSMYVNRLNGLGLTVGTVQAAIGAASISDVMYALREPNRKCPEFAKLLPDDSTLHRFARDREFLEVAWKVAQRPVRIDVDDVVDTESNLKPVVLRKILYRMGLDPDTAKPWEPAIHMLLNRRNDIAHGTAREGLEEVEYFKLEQAVTLVIDGVVATISDAVIRKKYLS